MNLLIKTYILLLLIVIFKERLNKIKYNTIIKNIKNRKLWNIILYTENFDSNKIKQFYYLQDFENFIKSQYYDYNNMTFVLFYHRRRKELYITSI